MEGVAGDDLQESGPLTVRESRPASSKIGGRITSICGIARLSASFWGGARVRSEQPGLLLPFELNRVGRSSWRKSNE
jgi:hypothetical protein